MSLSINHKSACVLLTAFVVVLQFLMTTTTTTTTVHSLRISISATGGLLVALTICICYGPSDAYGALVLRFLILHSSSSSTRMWWLTDVSLLSSFSYIFQVLKAHVVEALFHRAKFYSNEFRRDEQIRRAHEHMSRYRTSK